MERGTGGAELAAVTRKGFDSTKTHDDTGLPNPPRKKIPKKIFRGSTFFFKKKIFCGFGVFCHHGFSVQNQTRVIMGFRFKPPDRVIKGFGPLAKKITR